MKSNQKTLEQKTAAAKLTFMHVWIAIGVIVLAAIALNVLGMLSNVLVFLATGSLIAFAATPMANTLERHGMARSVASAIAVIVVVLCLVGVVAGIIPLFVTQFADILMQLPSQLGGLFTWFDNLVASVDVLDDLIFIENINDAVAQVLQLFADFAGQFASRVSAGLFPLISSVVQKVVVVALGVVLAFWITNDYLKIHEEICTILGDKADDYRFLMTVLSRSVGGYCKSQLVIAGANGVLATAGFALVGHPYPMLMGAFTALMQLVPVIGTATSAAIATLTAFFHNPLCALLTLIVAVVMQNISDSVIGPKVMQSTISIHPVMSLTAIIIGSQVMGALGVLIAIPLAAALKGAFIFYFEQQTARQLVSWDGAIFKGRPFVDAQGNPVSTFDALGDDTFVRRSELVDSELLPEASAVPKPENLDKAAFEILADNLMHAISAKMNSDENDDSKADA